MTGVAPEFSRLVALERLGTEPFFQRIEATREECLRLARRFDLVALARLVASVRLIRQGDRTIRLEAEFEAEFEQDCVVTLEPVSGSVQESFSLIYGPKEDVAGGLDLDPAAPAFEPFVGDAIDIGEAVAQELSLALPLSPRDPEATIEADDVATLEESPFAALAALRKVKKD